jgi:hypothetical protein
MASKWDSDKIKQVESTFDWTYSSYYHGTFRLFQGARASPAALQRVEEPNGLDMQLLTRPDPILWCHATASLRFIIFPFFPPPYPLPFSLPLLLFPALHCL